MTRTRHTLVALGFFAVACGGTVNAASDGTGGGAQAGNGSLTAGAGGSTGGNSGSAGTAGASTSGGGGTGGDAGPDGPAGNADAPATTCGAPVWLPTSTGFSLRVAGGMPNPLYDSYVDAGGCMALHETYDFSTSTGMLSHRGCDWFQSFDEVFRVAASEMNQILDLMGALRTACPGSPCLADCPGQDLTVREGSDATPPRVFSGDCFSGCLSNYTPTVPEVDFHRLETIAGTLGLIAAAHCPGAGACTDGDVPRDSGIDAPTD